MKLSLTLLTFSTIILLTTSHCKKNTEEPTLPTETITGAMTFGCKVNGKVFVPRDGRGKPGLFVQYVYMGIGPGGGWYLNIPATNWVPASPEGLTIQTDSLLVVEGQTYEFQLSSSYQPIKGTANAVYYNGSDTYPKLNIESGSLFIKKFDQANRILSGTFFFTGTNPDGLKVSVSDGRFDVRY
jgi:hypothetical protein